MAQDQTMPATSMKAAAAVAVAGGGGGENDDVPRKTLSSQLFTEGAQVMAWWKRTLWRPCRSLAQSALWWWCLKRHKRWWSLKTCWGLATPWTRQPTTRSIWWAAQLLSSLPARKSPAPGTWMTPGAPTVAFSLPSRTPSVPLPWKFFILSVTLVVLSRALWFYRRMASRPWWTLCRVPGELRPHSLGWYVFRLSQS